MVMVMVVRLVWLLVCMLVVFLIQVVVEEVFSRELVIMVVLLVMRVLFRCFIFLFFIRLVWVVMFIRVLVVLNSLIRKNISIIFNRFMEMVFLMFSCRKVGVIEGGVVKMFEKWLLLKMKDSIVISRMLISSVLCIFNWFSVMMIRKLMMVIIGVGWCRLLRVMKVVGLVVMMLVFFREMIVRNSLMLVGMVVCKDCGMFLMISLWICSMFISKNRQFEISIVFSVVCYGKFMFLIMVQVKQVFKFMLGVRLIGQLVYRFMISVFIVVVIQVVIKIEFLGMLVLFKMLGLMKMM